MDYNAVTTNITWEVVDEQDKRNQRAFNQTQYVNTTDDDQVYFQTAPQLSRIDNFSKNVKSRSRQSSAAPNNINSSLTTSLPTSTSTPSADTNISLNNTINSVHDYEDLKQWKPSILKTYRVPLKSPKDFSNKELLALLKLYHEYFDKQIAVDLHRRKHSRVDIMIDDEDEDEEDSKLVSNGSTTKGGDFGVMEADEEEKDINKPYNEIAYKSFMSLYNWFEKENKKGGQQTKLQRVEQFCTDNLLWYLPADLAAYLEEYYNKTQGLTKRVKQIWSSLSERDKYYIYKMKQIIKLQNKLLKNVNFIQINGIKLYYKIHYPANYHLYSHRTPLILISECAQLKEDWFRLSSELSANRPVITFDMRGIGQTGICTSASLQNNYSIDLIASDIAGLIENIAITKQRRVFVLGNGGIGGIVAMTLSIRFEHLIAGLILCNTLMPSNNGPSNVYMDKYNQKIIVNSNFRNKLRNSNESSNGNQDFLTFGCVESVTLVANEEDPRDYDRENAQDEDDDDAKQPQGGEVDADDNVDDVESFFYKDYSVKSKYNEYSYIIETLSGNKQYPFVFSTLDGCVPSSLLNRPYNGIMAQQNGYLKLISTSTNVISSRINEIKQSTLVLYGARDYVVTPQQTEYLAQRITDVPRRDIKLLNNAGHLWWLTHCKESAQIIDEFVFKAERDLLTRYDVVIDNVQMLQNRENLDMYTLCICSTSFISDEQDEYPQEYEISSSDLESEHAVQCKFLCVMADLNRKALQIRLESKSKKLIGIGQCMLTEAMDAALMMDIVNVEQEENPEHSNQDDDDVLMRIQLKHGWNKHEFQQRLNQIDAPHGFVTQGGDARIDRLDSADLDGLDL